MNSINLFVTIEVISFASLLLKTQQTLAHTLELKEKLLNTSDDIEILTKMVLIRGHTVIDPSQSMPVDESLMERLLDRLYINQYRTHFLGGRRVYPATEERELDCEHQLGKAKNICHFVSSPCLSTKHIQIVASSPNLHQLISRICPLLLFLQAHPICKSHLEEDPKNKWKLVEPPLNKVYGFGILFVTLSIVVSMGGLILLPFVRREARRTILTFFEGLAVGGLVGTAIIHLFPQAFHIVDEKFQNYFWKVFVIFTGIYLFYILERILKLIAAWKGKGKRKRTPSFREEDHLSQRNTPISLSPAVSVLNVNQYQVQTKSGNKNLVPQRSPREQMRKYLASINSPSNSINQPMKPQEGSQVVLLEKDRKEIPRIDQTIVSDVAGRRKDQDTTSTMPIDSVAWMIVLGDASLNFIDGLSIGAAFDRNILAGISISIAVMLEEVTHRLGTFAVLIRAGMKMKQSFLWIFISACSLYPGLVLGVFLGDEAEYASPYIFALAGGMFVYMALVDVMKEMNASIDNATRKGLKSAFRILALQNAGIIIAIFFLSVLALYEDKMDFEAVEFKELSENSLNSLNK